MPPIRPSILPPIVPPIIPPRAPIPVKTHSWDSLDQKIARWADGKEADDFALEAKEVDHLLHESHKSLRDHWYSFAAISQDNTLRLYRSLISLDLWQRGMKDIRSLSQGETINDEIIFPDCHLKQIHYVCRFIMFAARNNDRSGKSRVMMLVALARHMWFWLVDALVPLARSRFGRKFYDDQTMKIIEYIDEVGIGGASRPPKLIQLIENDFAQTKGIEAAEERYVVWLFDDTYNVCLQCFDNNESALKWRDIQISRVIDEYGVWSGKFIMEIEFPPGETQRSTNKLVKMTVVSPRSNPMLSLPHRLLTMLIRRKLLLHHDTVESLMAYTPTGISRENRFMKIALKEEALDQPVFIFHSSQNHSLEDKHRVSDRSSVNKDNSEGEHATVASYITMMKSLISWEPKKDLDGKNSGAQPKDRVTKKRASSGKSLSGPSNKRLKKFSQASDMYQSQEAHHSSQGETKDGPPQVRVVGRNFGTDPIVQSNANSFKSSTSATIPSISALFAAISSKSKNPAKPLGFDGAFYSFS